MISLGEGAERGKGSGGSFQTQVNPSCSWEAPGLDPTRLITRPWTKLEARQKWLCNISRALRRNLPLIFWDLVIIAPLSLGRI